MNKSKIKFPTLSDNIQFKAIIKHVNDNFDLEVEKAELIARIMKVKYNSLLKEGFDEHQALELTKDTKLGG